MKSHPSTLSVVLSFFLFSPCLFADEKTPPLSWLDCVRAARDNNPDLRASVRTVEAARASYKESFNGWIPSLSFTDSYNRTDVSDGAWSASGNASMDLLNLQTNANVRSASASLDQAAADLNSKSSQVRFDLRQAFANLLFSQEDVIVSKKIEELRHRNADLVSLKYDSGRESKGNMLQAKAELVEAKAGLADAIRNLKVAQQELNRQMGPEVFTEVHATGTLTGVPAPPALDVQGVLQTHPSVKSAEASVRLSEAELKGAKSPVWPSLSAHYSRFYDGDNYFPGDPHWSASGVLNFPIFGSGFTSTYYSALAARRGLERSVENLRSAKDLVRTDLEGAWAGLSSSIDQIEVQDQFLGAARQRNTEAMVRYSSGLMTFENWEIVVSDLVNFERSSIRADRDAMIAEARYYLALGKTLEEQ